MGKKRKKNLAQYVATLPGTIHAPVYENGKLPKISITDYDEVTLQEKDAQTPEECFPYKETPTVSWLNFDGIPSVEIIEKIGSYFELHPLILEDITHTEQRPKIEDCGSSLFIVVKMLSLNGGNEIKAEQLSIILSSLFVISIQEHPGGDVFDPIRDRIRTSKGKIRKMGTDYLAYSLLDSIVDNYFIILEKFGERIEALEEELVTDPTPNTLKALYSLKREMIFLRKAVWPMREMISSLQRLESPLLQKATAIYLRDLYDHTIQVMDTVETFRDVLSGMVDIYLSSTNNRMNQVMKVLTIITTIFIPMSLIPGLYGMNVPLPGSHSAWTYPVIVSIMVSMGIFMMIFFRKQKWI